MSYASLPASLATALDNELRRHDRRALAAASDSLTAHYRDGLPAGRTMHLSAEHHAAYAMVRMPATFAACAAVLERAAEVLPGFGFASHLDLFSGPGTMVWALDAVAGGHAAVTTMVEQDAAFIALARRLAGDGGLFGVQGGAWMPARIPPLAGDLPPHDLVTIAYGLGELRQREADAVVEQAWARASTVLVIVEPGTPRGFALVESARRIVLAHGARIAAPCPHDAPCPMVATGRWCHFSQRLPRSREHRQIKGAAVGFEDEKYSYLVAVREATSVDRTTARIIGRPRVRNAGADLPLCRADGSLADVLVAKRDKENFRAARRVGWGDAWPPQRENLQSYEVEE